MTMKNDTVSAMRSLRNSLLISENPTPKDFCTIDNYEDAIVTLFEEIEAFDIAPLNDEGKISIEENLESLFVKLMNSSWNLIHKHRMLMTTHEKLKDQQCRIANDNSALSNHVKRLKEVVRKKDNALSELQEKERQLKVTVNSLTRDLKREKEENQKLKKQLQSKDTQHAHELRRVQQNGNKLRDQLQKSAGVYVPRSKAAQNLQTEQEKKVRLYKQTINRLEENNGLMLQEINDLRDALALRTTNIWEGTA